MEIDRYFPAHYYIRTLTTEGCLLIIRIHHESALEPKEVVGEILYCSISRELEGKEYREKKKRLANSKYEFSKIGFEIPNPNPIAIESFLE